MITILTALISYFDLTSIVGLTASVGEAKHFGCYYGAWAYTRPGMGEFWPEDIPVELCDVIYYGFGNVLNDTYEVCSWDPWFDMDMGLDSDALDIFNCIKVVSFKYVIYVPG